MLYVGLFATTNMSNLLNIIIKINLLKIFNYLLIKLGAKPKPTNWFQEHSIWIHTFFFGKLNLCFDPFHVVYFKNLKIFGKFIQKVRKFLHLKLWKLKTYVWNTAWLASWVGPVWPLTWCYILSFLRFIIYNTFTMPK